MKIWAGHTDYQTCVSLAAYPLYIHKPVCTVEGPGEEEDSAVPRAGLVSLGFFFAINSNG